MGISSRTFPIEIKSPEFPCKPIESRDGNSPHAQGHSPSTETAEGVGDMDVVLKCDLKAVSDESHRSLWSVSHRSACLESLEHRLEVDEGIRDMAHTFQVDAVQITDLNALDAT